MRTARAPAALLLLGALLAAFNFANVLLLKVAVDLSIYTIDALVLFLASAAVFLIPVEGISPPVKFRMRLWAGSLACYGVAFFWSGLRNMYFPGGLSRVQILLYATTYALAFLAVVSPPSGQRWGREWWLDGLQAVVLASMFFQTSLVLAHGLDHLLFTCLLQVFLGTAALLASRGATTHEERRFTLCVGAYYLFTAALSLGSNVSALTQDVWASNLADALYPLDSLLALILAFVMRAIPCKQRDLSPNVTSATPMLTSAAIVLLCIPTLRAERGQGALLISSAVLLFGMRVSILPEPASSRTPQTTPWNRRVSKTSPDGPSDWNRESPRLYDRFEQARQDLPRLSDQLARHTPSF